MTTLAAALAFADHGDWQRAVPAARQALAADPDDPMAHALLALGLAHLEQVREAVDAGRKAVALAPELAFAHYAHGWALVEDADLGAAERAAKEALRLDPGGNEHALLALVHLRQRRWQDALDVAEAGLQVNPDHAGCANLRAVALSNLGRAAEAVDSVHEVLSMDPDDAYAHANRGWLMLRQSKPDEAIESFKAALRLDPSMDWARAGIVEAIKARNVLYRVFLRYSLWVGSLTSQKQWFLIAGVYVGGRITRATLASNPGLAPVLMPLLIAYTLFVLGTWIATPLSNLFLRLHPMGRLALNRFERIASNAVGVCLGIGLIAGAMFFVTRTDSWFTLALVSGLMLMPIGGASNGLGTKAWRPLVVSVLAFALMGLAAVASSFAGSPFAGVLFAIFGIGAFFYGWLANYLIIKYQ